MIDGFEVKQLQTSLFYVNIFVTLLACWKHGKKPCIKGMEKNWIVKNIKLQNKARNKTLNEKVYSLPRNLHVKISGFELFTF